MAEWVIVLNCRPGGPGFEYCCGNFASVLWQFRLPCFANSFGGDTKSRRSLLSGVYARGSERSHQSALEMCNLSSTAPILEKDNLKKKKPAYITQVWVLHSIGRKLKEIVDVLECYLPTRPHEMNIPLLPARTAWVGPTRYEVARWRTLTVTAPTIAMWHPWRNHPAMWHPWRSHVVSMTWLVRMVWHSFTSPLALMTLFI